LKTAERGKSQEARALSSKFGSALSLPTSPAEIIETFAADCSTPRTSFVLGETVCAKTTGVTETNRFVNWAGPSGPAFGGAGTTDITTNQPQDFLYTPTQTGSWTAAIADSSNSSIISADFTVTAPGPIVTYRTGCTIPETNFALGDTICARVTGGTTFPRRITFVDPAGFIRQITPVTSDPQDISFQVPSTQTSTINGEPIDNRGTWRVNMISSRSSVVASAQVVVTDPANKAADLFVSSLVQAGNEQIGAGSSGAFEIFVRNSGPDAAVNVVLTDVIPANTAFVAMTQTDGPSFTCTTPSPGGTGTISCTIAALARGATATFSFAFDVNSGAAPGTRIDNTATITSDIADPNTSDNSSTAFITVATSGSGGTCTVGCPNNVSVVADTTDSEGTEGAVVHFDAPTGGASCGAISLDHCNDCFFPIGTTVVNATSDTGDSCSFTVTVNSANAPTITCPTDKEVNADANCEAVVTLGTPTTSGGANVTIHGVRSDGKPMYDCDTNGENCVRKSQDLPFAAGTTTITWTATSHNTNGEETGNASCTQRVTVNDVTPPVIAATDQTIPADANCQATVPDYSSTVSDNCSCSNSDTSNDCIGHPHFTVTQDPAPGTVVGLGTYSVHITANDGSSNNGGAGNTSEKTITLTVADTTPPTFTFVPPTVVVYTGPGATTCDAVVSNATLGTATATDNCSAVTITRSPSGNTFPVGNTTVVWTATDAAGNQATANQTVTVIDNTPPTITLNGSTPSMWPPNHKYQTFNVTSFVTSVFDNCGASVSDVVIDHVTSDETENGNGDGNTMNDILIASDCKSVQLRSEREGGGNGRVYTITFRLTDSHGNTTTATAKVVVAHNPGETPVDSGVHYTVNGNCP